MTSNDLERLVLIHRAYEEDPVNIRYLIFLQFGIIEGITLRNTRNDNAI